MKLGITMIITAVIFSFLTGLTQNLQYPYVVFIVWILYTIYTFYDIWRDYRNK